MKWHNKVHPFLLLSCTLLALLPPSPLPSQTDTVQRFYPKGFKGFLLLEYKTLLPLELLMVAEKQKKVRNTSL